MEKVMYSVVGTIISILLGTLLKGQSSIRKEAKDGREKIYKKIEDQNDKHNELSHEVNTLKAHHKQNHPGQL